MNQEKKDEMIIELVRLQGIIDAGIDQQIHPKVWNAIEQLLELKRIEICDGIEDVILSNTNLNDRLLVSPEGLIELIKQSLNNPK